MAQLFTTIQEVCGMPWLCITSLVAAMNVVVALRLVFFSQSVVGLVAFMPVSFLPLVLGVLAATTGLLQSIEISIGDALSRENPALLLSWALLPLLLGGAMSTPAYAIASLGRLWLATRGSRQPQQTESTRADRKSQNGADNDAAYQAYADFVNTTGHRKSK